MNAVAVFVKSNGILVACRAYPTPDGCVWRCAKCQAVPLLRASFGVLSGFWRCPCGAEVELLVDGQPVAIQELNALDEPQQQVNRTNAPEPQGEFDEAEFLRECGIAIPEEQC